MVSARGSRDTGMIRFGVDLGGTKIEIVGLDARGAEVLRRRVATPAGDYRAVIDAVAGLVAGAERELGIMGTVGIGTPGSISRATGLLRGSNSVCLNGQPIKRDFESALAREVRISNDANCFALSEATDGSGEGAGVVFGAILGTGVGAGIVVHGRVLDGPNAIAGEWGHNPLPWPRDDERPGPACFCGHYGLHRDVRLRSRSRTRSPARRRAAEITARSQPARNWASEACEATFARYEDRLARSLAHVVNLLDPDVIVLGGGLSNIGRLYRSVPALWEPWIFSDRVDTRLVRHRHGDSSGVRGAAWLWGG